MYHQDLNPCQLEPKGSRKRCADFRTINITINTPHGFERLQPFQHRQRANVTGMPDLIARHQMRQKAIIKMRMRIGKKSDNRHTTLVIGFHGHSTRRNHGIPAGFEPVVPVMLQSHAQSTQEVLKPTSDRAVLRIYR